MSQIRNENKNHLLDGNGVGVRRPLHCCHVGKEALVWGARQGAEKVPAASKHILRGHQRTMHCKCHTDILHRGSVKAAGGRTPEVVSARRAAEQEYEALLDLSRSSHSTQFKSRQ